MFLQGIWIYGKICRMEDEKRAAGRRSGNLLFGETSGERARAMLYE
jgi:hypothetical protein